MTLPTDFTDAVTITRFDMGRGGWVIRTEHPALPGGAILGMVEPGLPDSSLQTATQACMEVLHADFIKQSEDFESII